MRNYIVYFEQIDADFESVFTFEFKFRAIGVDLVFNVGN